MFLSVPDQQQVEVTGSLWVGQETQVASSYGDVRRMDALPAPAAVLVRALDFDQELVRPSLVWVAARRMH